jgi:hypothetical protein
MTSCIMTMTTRRGKKSKRDDFIDDGKSMKKERIETKYVRIFRIFKFIRNTKNTIKADEDLLLLFCCT